MDRKATIEQIRAIVRQAFAADHRLQRISVECEEEALVFHVDEFTD